MSVFRGANPRGWNGPLGRLSEATGSSTRRGAPGNIATEEELEQEDHHMANAWGAPRLLTREQVRDSL
jgi:hypothetical protein